MATRNFVPRNDGEGSIGTTAKQWSDIQAKEAHIGNRNILADGTKLDTHETEIDMLQTKVTTLEHAYAGAKAAATVADMTDHNQIYVYVGSESGYTNGNWYYWDGNAWTSGGVYNATALETDKTLTVSGAAADAKVTGDKINENHADITNMFKYISKYAQYVEKGNMIYPSLCYPIGVWFYNGTKYQYEQGNNDTKRSRAYIVSVKGGSAYKYYGYNVSDGLLNSQKAMYVNWYDADFNFISTSINSNTFTAPANASYVILQASVLANVGDVTDAYYPYMCNGSESAPASYSGYNGVSFEELNNNKYLNPSILNLPPLYRVTVGDTFQLFYKGIILLNDWSRYYLKLSCDIGSQYERYFEVTPNSNQHGFHILYIDLYDNYDRKVLSAYTQLAVSSVKSNPVSVKNVLCVGDSLTVDGEWPSELNRRISDSGGSPAGNELTNVHFVGTCEKNGYHYEGYGGWTFASYNGASKSNKFLWITTSTVKTAGDQHSLYKDSNNNTWILETIESGKMKIICQNSSNPTMLTSGTLTYLSGGESTNDIVYTYAEQAAGNPFWNSDSNEVDFANYASELGISSIDYCYVLLGWNNMNTAPATIKANAQTFIDNLHADFPNCIIVLMGLEIPSLDGLGRNYGTSHPYMNESQFVKTIDTINMELASANSNVYTINISGQFDTEYNMQTGTRKVNTRNPQTIAYQNNGIHPALYGYYQIADAAYRDLMARL